MDDPFVGLEVGGKIYYCARSTLSNATGSYFEALFRPNSFSPGASFNDGRGRAVYSIDRNPDSFAYVLEFLRKGRLNLPKFSQAPELWRDLRDEAEFYCLDGMLNFLRVNYSCRPGIGNDKGIMHWLGTAKGTRPYCNPRSDGSVHVVGWVDEEIDVDIFPGDTTPQVLSRSYKAASEESRNKIVGYRPEAFSLSTDGVADISETELLGCMKGINKFVTIRFQDVLVRPTHYSFRYGDCFGALYWEFEASTDGKNWQILHEGRDRGENYFLSDDEINELTNVLVNNDDIAFFTYYLEQTRRVTWSLGHGNNPSEFYQFFRISRIEQEAESGEDDYLHLCGLEIFGDVCEK